MRLINQILKEATLERDLSKNNQAKSILKQLERIVYNYNEDTDNTAFNPKQYIFFTKIDNLEFILFDYRSSSPIVADAEKRGSKGFFNKEQERVYFFLCKFTYNERLNRITGFEYDERGLYHEIIHSLDLQNTQHEKFQGRPQKINDKEDYLNQSVELNAHWMERIMPFIETLISGGNETSKVIKQHGFDSFKKFVFQQPQIQNYYTQLYPKNQKRFLKRLADYYQKLTKKV